MAKREQDEPEIPESAVPDGRGEAPEATTDDVVDDDEDIQDDDDFTDDDVLDDDDPTTAR